MKSRSLAALVMTMCVAAALPAAAQLPTAQAANQIGAIPEPQLTVVAKTAMRLTATPNTIALKVGQKVDLSGIVVTVFDSTGKVRGRLAGYDFSIAPNAAASVVPRVVTGVYPGTADLVIRFPRNFWKRPDPRAEVKVKVVVTK